jgi:hypothetical protein
MQARFASNTFLVFFAVNSLDTLLSVVSVFIMRLVKVHDFFMNPTAQRFTRQQFAGSVGVAIHDGWRACFHRRVAVIIIFEVFKDVTDVQESVAIQADVDESRLHAW